MIAVAIIAVVSAITFMVWGLVWEVNDEERRMWEEWRRKVVEFNSDPKEPR